MLDKRLSQLTGSKQSLMAAVKEDGRIHGSINPMGTITGEPPTSPQIWRKFLQLRSPTAKSFEVCFKMPPGWQACGS
jgi:DNA polymerase-1